MKTLLVVFCLAAAVSVATAQIGCYECSQVVGTTNAASQLTATNFATLITTPAVTAAAWSVHCSNPDGPSSDLTTTTCTGATDLCITEIQTVTATQAVFGVTMNLQWKYYNRYCDVSSTSLVTSVPDDACITPYTGTQGSLTTALTSDGFAGTYSNGANDMCYCGTTGCNTGGATNIALSGLAIMGAIILKFSW